MAANPIQRGATIDGFLVGELIHTGGMATLRTVTRPDIRMPILMKIPTLLEGDDPAAVVGFEMEQMILPRLSGVHVPKFVAAGDFSVHPYIVMERIAGQTLLHRLDDLPLPYAEVVAIGARVAVALDDLHRQHVVHLDVKPSNIVMREGTGDVALVDFGLAHHDQLPDLMGEEFRLPYGTGPSWRPSRFSATGATHGAISSRSACSSISSRRACGPSATRRANADFTGDSGAIRSRRANAGPISRHGCRRSFFAVSRWTPPDAIPRRPSSRSTSRIPKRPS